MLHDNVHDNTGHVTYTFFTETSEQLLILASVQQLSDGKPT